MTQTKAELLQTRHQGDIRLGDADSTNYVGFKAPATVGSNLVWTLPATDGSANQFLQTNASGVLSWGTADTSASMPLTGGTFTGAVTFNDNIRARFGTGADLQIFHDGSDDKIISGSTNSLIIATKYGRIMNAAGNETQAKFYENGAVELYHDNNLRLQTWADGVNIHGDEGQSGILHIYADNGDNNADKWRFEASAAGSFNLANYSTGSWVNGITLDGSNNVTFAANATITGDLTVNGTTTTIDTTTLRVEDKNIEIGKVSTPSDTTADGGGLTLLGSSNKTFNWVNSTDAWTSSEHIHLGDNKKLLVGTGSDLQIFHNGSHSYIEDSGTGNLYIRSSNTRMQTPTGEDQIILVENGAVELYYDNVKQVRTSSTGIFLEDSKRVDLGTGADLRLVHDGSHGYVQNNTGNLRLDGDLIQLRKGDGTENYLIGNADGSVDLYFNGSKKFETQNAGIHVTGTATFSGSVYPISDDAIQLGLSNRRWQKLWASDEINMDDNGKVQLGTSNDLQLYHDGTQSVIEGTAPLYIKGSNVVIYKGGTTEKMLQCTGDGATSLWYDSAKKLETTSGGVNVTGALTVNGAALGGSSYTATADGAIAAGDPVSVATDGKLKKSGELTFDANWTMGSTTTLDSTKKWEYSAGAPDPHKTNRFAITFTDDNSDKYVYLQIYTISGSTITKSGLHPVYNSAGNNSHPCCVFDHVAEGRVLVIWQNTSGHRKATLVNFTGAAGSESFSNVSGATYVGFGNHNNHVGNQNVTGNQPQQIRYYGDNSYLQIYQRSYQSTSYYMTFTINGDSINTVQGGQFWAEATKSPAGFDLDPADLKKGVATIARTSNGVWYMKTFTIASNDTVSWGGEETVTGTTSSTYAVNTEYGYNHLHYVGPGQFVVAAVTSGNSGWSGISRDYTPIFYIVKVNNNTYTKASPVYCPIDYVGTPSSNNEPVRFLLTNNKDNRTTLSCVTRFSGSNNNINAFRLDCDLTNNTIANGGGSYPRVGNTQTQVVASSVLQFGTLMMGPDTDRTTFLMYNDFGNNTYGRVMLPGGPGNDLNSYIGLADSSVSSGASVTATIVGGKATTSGLTIGKRYYVQLDGTLGTSPATTDVTAGIALSATSLLVTT
jgi:hypothetical protein